VTSSARAALVVLLGACGASPPAITADAVPAIERMLDDWHDAASRADEARYFGHFTADAIFLGTDATERWTVPQFREYAHPHFEAGSAWSFRATRRGVVIDPGGRIAWFDEDLATEGLGPARGSGVLLRGEDGRWRIAQYNLAITVPNERFAAVRALLAAPPEPPTANEP
jgi:ketosteroid isomerase-like protein